MLKFLDRFLSRDVSRHIQRFIFLLCLAFAGVVAINGIITFPSRVVGQCLWAGLVVIAAFAVNEKPPLKVWECALFVFFFAGPWLDAYDDGFSRTLHDAAWGPIFCAMIHGTRHSIMPQEEPQSSPCHSDEAPGER